QERGDGVPPADRGEGDDQEEVEEKPEGDEHPDVAEHPPNLGGLVIDRVRQVEDRGDGILHRSGVPAGMFAVHGMRLVWAYLMGSGRCSGIITAKNAGRRGAGITATLPRR